MAAKTVPAESIAALEQYFAALPDPRIERCRRHKLIDIVTIAICTLLCGGEGFTDMEEFGHSRKEWLETFLELPSGTPRMTLSGASSRDWLPRNLRPVSSSG